MAVLKRQRADGSWEYVEYMSSELVNRTIALETDTTTLNTNTANLQTDLTFQKQHTIVKSNKDANGIYTTITLKRSDATIYMVSVLSGGTSPNYTTRTETYYKADGITVDVVKTYTRSYDTDGDLLSEVIA